MAEVSRRAAKPAARGGLPNAMFVVAAAEAPPPELLGIADELTINFPWGSLLRGALALDGTSAAGIAGLLRPGACLTVFVSITDRDGLAVAAFDAPAMADALSIRWAAHGLRLEKARPASVDELEATRSSWARRLRAGHDRPAWRLSLRRIAVASMASGDVSAKAG
jgi:16S rRNA (adenine(1408)-N(1))-methyltransferase